MPPLTETQRVQIEHNIRLGMSNEPRESASRGAPLNGKKAVAGVAPARRPSASPPVRHEQRCQPPHYPGGGLDTH